MSWFPNDLVADADLTAYEKNILSAFRETDWEGKRAKALEDWLAPILRTHGYAIETLRTRYEVDQAWSYTASAYADQTGASGNTTTDDLNLATIFATVGTDALYLGSTQPFRGLSFRVLDSPSAVTASLTVAFWADKWVNLTIADGTSQTAGKAFSGGGSVTWRTPATWVKRAVNGSDALYWVKVSISATPTSAKAGQIGVIRRSCFCAPVAYRTLELIYQEAPTGSTGPWLEKAAYYRGEADVSLQRALQICGGEFETDDPGTDLISPTEAAQTTDEAGGGPFRMERG